ncbi:MAG TPA: hypothetical protein VK002_07655, partial [Rubricoccaceae bacterium]|nr:hypothetical protein [Rubricoccaceae bacterium]
MPRLALLALLGLTGLSAAHAQPADKPASEPRFFGLTAEQILSREPASPNPYLAFLPEGVAPDYTYWRARLALESFRRAITRGLTKPRTRGVTARYAEQEGAVGGANDTPDTAERLPAFAGGRGDLELTGDFGPAPQPTATSAAAVPEGPAGQMTHQVLRLDAAAQRYVVEGAQIGDGPYGTTTGDVDLYVLDVTVPRSYVRISVDSPESDLDPVLAFYDAAGVPLAIQDDDDETDRDPSAMVLLEAPGQYHLFVYGYAPKAWPPGLEDPADPASGYGAGSTGSYVLDVSLQQVDPDAYAVDLQAGDVIAITTPTSGMYDLAIYDPSRTLRMRSVEDLSPLYPEEAPFLTPAELDPGNQAVAGKTAVVVASTAGTYTIMAHGEGPYRIHVLAARPGVEAHESGRQTIFVDFDGAVLVPPVIFGEGKPFATLSPLSAFLPRWGLTAADEDAVIDAVMATLRENLLDDLRHASNNPDVDLVLLNSRDHADPFGTPGVSRLIIGGTIEETGIETIGLASEIDPGNFSLEDTAFILLDLLSEAAGDPNSLNQYALAPGRTKAELVGHGIG